MLDWMPTPAMISYQIAATTTTKASPERIFAVLDDFGRWPTWMPAFNYIKVELPRSGEPSLGYRFRLRSGPVHTDMEVVGFTPLSRATKFRISFPPFTGVNSCLVFPLDDGSCRIERVDSLDLPEFVAGLITAAQRARFDRLAEEFLIALKAVVELED
jgi:hypothetical protein